MSRANLRHIFQFWIPLASTWAMMSVEGPLLAAVIARLADAKFNLAAYGIAFSVGMLVESPIINMMAAATALVRDRDSYLRLRNFTHALNAVVTVVMLILGISPLFRLIAVDLMGITTEVVELARGSILLLLPWPGAIGFRRFYQGVLIAGGKTRRVAMGTLLRLFAMGGSALALASLTDLPGALVGAGSLSIGVCVEALVVRLMASDCVELLLAHSGRQPPPLYLEIGRFYYPLALTSILALAVHPMVTLLAGLGVSPVESLAVLPVVNSLAFIFRAPGLSFQEAVISFLGRSEDNLLPLRKFAGILAGFSSIGLLAIAFTPLANWWFSDVSGLSPGLASFAGHPTRVIAFIPALTVLLVWQRSLLIHSKQTGPITWAAAIEVSLILGSMLAGLFFLRWDGALSATVSYLIGRLGACGYLGFQRRLSRNRLSVSGHQ